LLTVSEIGNCVVGRTEAEEPLEELRRLQEILAAFGVSTEGWSPQAMCTRLEQLEEQAGDQLRSNKRRLDGLGPVGEGGDYWAGFGLGAPPTGEPRFTPADEVLFVENDDWARTGPWSTQLSGLEDAVAWNPSSGEGDRSVAVEAMPCDRCNWPGRYPWLIGREDGNKPERVRPRPGSVGATKPLLPGYLAPTPGGSDRVGTSRACVQCGGGGYLEVGDSGVEGDAPSGWNTGPRRRSVRGQIDGEVVESEDGSTEWSSIDGLGRLGGSTDTGISGLARVIEREPSPDELSIAVDEPAQEAAPAGTLSEERRLVREVLAETGRYVAEGPLALVEPGAPGHVRERVKAQIRDYDENAPWLRPLEERQAEVDQQITGGGRKDERRARLFAKREASYIVAVLLGYPLERVAAGTPIGEKQLTSMPLLMTIRAAADLYQQREILGWAAEERSTSWIAHVYGLDVRQVQRILKQRLTDPSVLLGLVSRLEQAPREVSGFVVRCLHEQMGPRSAAISGYLPIFFGIPTYDYPTEPEPYHSWLTENRLRDLAPLLAAHQRFRASMTAADGEECQATESQLDMSDPLEYVGPLIPRRDGVLPPPLFALLAI
jgi:hypothetical protein